MTSAERHEARYKRRRAKREAKKAERNELYTFDKVFTFSHLYRSYQQCCKGVRWKKSTQLYRANAMLNVGVTYLSLKNGTFRSRGFYSFDIFERGKERHIRAVHISERVVQRCACDYGLIPLLSCSFIHDNGASLKNKGISFTRDRVVVHLREYWVEHGAEGYILIFDVHWFFDSIPHELVYEILDKAVLDERFRDLIKYFIAQFGDVGLGLGSQVSQISALAALSGLDHFVKEQLHIRYYARYMDDGYLIHHDKEHLVQCRDAIIRFCKEIGLELNENKTQIRPLHRGFRFLKVRYILQDDGTILRLPYRKNTTAHRRKLKVFRRWVDDGGNPFTFHDAQTSHVSWMGHHKGLNSWRTVTRTNALYEQLFEKELKQDV